jgi:two-component system CheB/CheR fusion protein
MALQNFLHLKDYAEYLGNTPNAVQALYQSILINVTSFFRDTDVYAFLQSEVLPLLLQHGSSILRIWVPGCATGEEVYSLAICLCEYLHPRLVSPTVQVFGTDISDQAIDAARAGIYRENQMENVSPERRQRFFYPVDGGYQIKKSVRELCVFARQDLISDPPFSDIDLISCRNVLIYLNPPLQQRILSFFHYSLKPRGFLLLGNSESIGDTTDFFDVFDSKTKIYTRRAVPSRVNFDFLGNYSPQEMSLEQRPGFSAAVDRTNLQQWADQIVLSRFAPVGVVVDQHLEILLFRGDTNPYLRIPSGEPSYNLLKMIRPSLLNAVRGAIEAAKQHGVSIRRSGLKYQDSAAAELSLEVIPFHYSTTADRCYLILFKDAVGEPVSALESETEEDSTEPSLEIQRLRQELAKARQALLDHQTMLQLTIEEKELTTQQLLVANEEILSSNEELKSTNEELQAAKEEIQAANEELRTTNEELKSRNLEARRANDDLVNLINNVDIPILILSGNLRIRHFTPAAQMVFKLIPSDVGRPISDLRFDLVNANLEGLVGDVITTLQPMEQEVQDQSGQWYRLRISPYRTADNQVMGAIVALVDIHNLKETEQSLRQTQAQLEQELLSMTQVQDLSLRLFSSMDLEAALHEVLETTLALLKTESGNICLYNPQRQVLEIVAQQGMGQDFLDRFGEITIDQDFVGSQFFEQGQRLIIENIEDDTSVAPYRQMAQLTGFQALQCTPLMNRHGQLLGVLAAYFKHPYSPSERELRLLDLYGRQTSELIALIQSERDKSLLTEQAQAAEAANASKDEFLAMLSHELRTPLTSISSWIQLMERDLLDENQMRQAIAAISVSTLTQTQLIEDLLDVSRIIQHRFKISPQPCDLTALIQEVITLIELQIAAKELTLEVDLPPAPTPLSLDPIRISQAISNLLTNAIKFTPPGGTIALRLIEGLGHIQVQVSDTGEGIAPEILPHVFERFRQADSSNTRRSGGLGVGLFLVHSIIEAHGGTVVADSPGVGRGTTFAITLPKTIATPQLPSATGQEMSLDGVRILLVEDDMGIAMTISLALRKSGAIVTTAPSASEAWEMLSQGLPDLLISDIGLPDVNGYDLIRQIRALPAHAGGNLPAIALSGYVDQPSVATALEAGFQVYLSKPVKLKELVTHAANLVQPLEP